MDRNLREKQKLEFKLKIRRLLPSWFLHLIRRRQVPLKKMLRFKSQYDNKKINESTKNNSLAIIMPCYNHAEYLPLAFESAISQTVLPDQIVLINDYSTDQTEKVMRDLVAKYEENNPGKIKFVVQSNEKNLGQAATISKAINLASTDLIMVLNDDDYLMHDAIAIVRDTFRPNPELAFVGGASLAFRGNNFIDSHPKYARQQKNNSEELTIHSPEEALGYEDFCSINPTHSGSSFSRVKAQSVDLYWPYAKRIVRFSDRDFQIRLNLLYPIGVYYKLPLCFWREDSSQDSGVNS